MYSPTAATAVDSLTEGQQQHQQGGRRGGGGSGGDRQRPSRLAASFRSWLRRSGIPMRTTATPTSTANRQAPSTSLALRQPPHSLPPPSWRHSNPTPLSTVTAASASTSAAASTGMATPSASESAYGFHPQRVFPASCHYLSSVIHHHHHQQQHAAAAAAAAAAGSATPSSRPPQYVWDPPPPYSHPPQPTTAGAAAASAAATVMAATAAAAVADSGSALQQQQSQQPTLAGNGEAAIGLSLQTVSMVSSLPAQEQPSQSCPTPTSLSRSNFGRQQQQQQQQAVQQQQQQSSPPRTTKSGILASNSSTRTSKSQEDITIDESIQSAMHLYEKNESNCLGLRARARKSSRMSSAIQELQPPPPTEAPPPPPPPALPASKSLNGEPGSELSAAATTATAATTQQEEQEERLVREVRQKLNALLLYKYQHNKATRELAEVRQALYNLQRHQQLSGGGAGNNHINGSLNHGALLLSPTSPSSSGLRHLSQHLQHLPHQSLTDLRRPGGGGGGGGHQPLVPQRSRASHVSPRNRNSTSSGTSSIENKYETIEKSLSPYKIHPDEKNSVGNQKIQVSIHKQLLLSHSSNNDGDHHHHHVNLNSAAGLRSLLSKSPITASSSCASSTHYAQISPLRGVGVGVGLPSPTPNYFQEISESSKLDHPSPGIHVGVAVAASGPVRGAVSLQRLCSPVRNPVARPTSSSGHLATAASASSSAITSNSLLGSPVKEFAGYSNSNNDFPQHQQESLRALSGSDPKLCHHAAGSSTKKKSPLSPLSPPPPPVAKKPAVSSLAVRFLQSAPTSPQRRVYPVYLRPEQNIPEVFNGSKFAPICVGARDDEDDDSDDGDGHIGSKAAAGGGGGSNTYEVNSRISRDDIVVTVRSAQV